MAALSTVTVCSVLCLPHPVLPSCPRLLRWYPVWSLPSAWVHVILAAFQLDVFENVGKELAPCWRNASPESKLLQRDCRGSALRCHHFYFNPRDTKTFTQEVCYDLIPTFFITEHLKNISSVFWSTLSCCLTWKQTMSLKLQLFLLLQDKWFKLCLMC